MTEEPILDAMSIPELQLLIELAKKELQGRQATRATRLRHGIERQAFAAGLSESERKVLFG